MSTSVVMQMGEDDVYTSSNPALHSHVTLAPICPRGMISDRSAAVVNNQTPFQITHSTNKILQSDTFILSPSNLSCNLVLIVLKSLQTLAR